MSVLAAHGAEWSVNNTHASYWLGIGNGPQELLLAEASLCAAEVRQLKKPMPAFQIAEEQRAKGLEIVDGQVGRWAIEEQACPAEAADSEVGAS